MADNKTQPTKESVEAFLQKVESEQKQKDSFTILQLMTEITNKQAVLWGPSLIGFGQYHYKYASGREGDFFLTGFSPRKQSLVVYIMSGFNKEKELMEKLGKFKTGKSCLYIKKLSDINMDILKELISRSVAYMEDNYPTL